MPGRGRRAQFKGLSKYQPREQRLVSEFLASHYPDVPTQTYVRLGSIRVSPGLVIESESEYKMFGYLRRFADAIIIEPHRLILLEAAIKPDPGDISKLQLYRRLLPETPEFSPYRHLPIAMMLLQAIDDPVVTAMARESGIEVVYYHPKWIDDYLATLYPSARGARGGQSWQTPSEEIK